MERGQRRVMKMTEGWEILPLRRGRRNWGCSARKRENREAALPFPNIGRDAHCRLWVAVRVSWEMTSGRPCSCVNGRHWTGCTVHSAYHPLGAGLCAVQRPVLEIMLRDRAQYEHLGRFVGEDQKGGDGHLCSEAPSVGVGSSCVALHGPRSQCVLYCYGEI